MKMNSSFVVNTLVLLVGILLMSLSRNDEAQASSNQRINFDDCGEAGQEIFQVEGATVFSSLEQHNYSINVNCHYLFQVPSQYDHFLVQIRKIRQGFSQQDQNKVCHGNLSIVNTDINGTFMENIYSIPLCNQNIDGMFMYTGPYIATVLQVNSSGVQIDSYQLTLTAVIKSSETCDRDLQFQCSHSMSSVCISRDIVCDGVTHCVGGEDEINCKKSSIAASQAPILRTTQRPPPRVLPTYRNVEEEDIYLWLPLIVVVVFTCVMVSVILVGRRYVEIRGYHRADSGQNNNNTNPAYTDVDGVPRTPPPSYTDLARQISYVSYISQHSDQLSIPPGYDEALNLPDSPSGRRRSCQRPSTSSTGSLGRSRNRNRPRIFSRSLSAQETRRRASTDSTLATPDTSGRPLDRTASDTSSVFYDPPLSATVIHEHPQWESETEPEETPSGSQQVEVTIEMNDISPPGSREEDCDSDSHLLHGSPDSMAPLTATSTPIANEAPARAENSHSTPPMSPANASETSAGESVARFYL